jgi:hypothetical protein
MRSLDPIRFSTALTTKASLLANGAATCLPNRDSMRTQKRSSKISVSAITMTSMLLAFFTCGVPAPPGGPAG